jgi:uncharacterized protein YyaL (SSP411 family)
MLRSSLTWVLYLTIAVAAGDSFAKPPSPPPGVKIPADTFQRWLAALPDAQIEYGTQTHLNSLILERSPYLLQHAGNPINWRSWSANSLKAAASEGKLIFLSIGYSACHWCHVMNRESFSDPKLATLINKNFIPIKVDREELPVIDQYYASVLAMVKGSAGWPLTAIINSSGQPIFVESYLSPDALAKLLSRVITLAEQQPQYLAQSARFLATAATLPQQANVGDARPLSAPELRQIATTARTKIDRQYGGFAGKQKFPNEAALSFLSAMRRQRLNPSPEETIDLQLTKMAQGGIYDHVNGGFFRYSTDRFWKAPHYEKMLYNQALLLQIYSEAFIATGKPLYKWVITDIVGFLQRWLQHPTGGYHSAISADIEEIEGLYYLWSPSVLDDLPAAASENAGLIAYRGPGQEGLVGIYLTRPDSSGANIIRSSLLKAGASKTKPFIDTKVITSWNAALLSGLLTAKRALGPDLAQVKLTDIEEMASRLWSQVFSAERETLYHVTYRGVGQVPGTLEDYAFLAKAWLDLYDATANQIWLKRARALADLILMHFVTGSEFGTTDSRHRSEYSPKPMQIADGELPAANAVAMQALWQVAVRQGDQRLKQELGPLVNQLRAQFRALPYDNLYAGGILGDIDLGSVSLQQYFAGGNGLLRAKAPLRGAENCGTATVDILLAPGWHVNSSQPFQDYLRPTHVHVVSESIDAGPEQVNVAYPAAETLALSFDDQPLSVYQGNVRLKLTAPEAKGCDYWASGIALTVNLQACTDQVCRAPELLRMLLPSDH